MFTRRCHNSLVFGCCLALLIGLCPWAARSETVVLHLRNGDRISGTIVSTNASQVVIATKWKPDLAIPLAEIERRETVPAPAEPDPPAAPAEPAPAIAAKKPEAAKPRAKNWKLEMQAGLDIGRGETDRDLYHTRVKFTHAHSFARERQLKNTLEHNFAYGTTEKEITRGGVTTTERVLSANRMDGSWKTEMDLSKRSFAYNLVSAGYDEIRKIDLQYEFGPGAGYRFIMRTNFALNGEAGMTYQMRKLESREQVERFYGRFAQDLTWKINDRLSLDEKLEFFPQVEDFGQHRIRFELNLNFKLTSYLFLNLTVIDNYDTQLPANVKRNDLQIRSSVGLRF